MACEHRTSTCADVNVICLTDGDGPDERVTGYFAELRIHCSICGTQFGFRGLPIGLHLGGAAVSPDLTEARLAIAPINATGPS